MGCDIHMHKEKQVGGAWVTADEWRPYDYGDGEEGKEIPFESRFHQRNYQLFGLLSNGVRCEHPFSFEPRGMPFNPSHEVKQANEDWDSDGHSHSYLYLHELKDMLSYLETATINVSGMKSKSGLDDLQKSIDSGEPDWNLLFPFCKWTTDASAVGFSIDVPASFYMGDCLKRIVESFDGVDGDNHRIVFWFDN